MAHIPGAQLRSVCDVASVFPLSGSSLRSHCCLPAGPGAPVPPWDSAVPGSLASGVLWELFPSAKGGHHGQSEGENDIKWK